MQPPKFAVNDRVRVAETLAPGMIPGPDNGLVFTVQSVDTDGVSAPIYVLAGAHYAYYEDELCPAP